MTRPIKAIPLRAGVIEVCRYTGIAGNLDVPIDVAVDVNFPEMLRIGAGCVSHSDSAQKIFTQLLT